MFQEAENLLEETIEGRLYGSLNGWERSAHAIVNAFSGNVTGDGLTIYMDPSKLPVTSGSVKDGIAYFGNYGTLFGGDYSSELVHGLDTGGIGASRYRRYPLPATGYFSVHYFKAMEAKMLEVLAKHLSGLGWNVS